MIKALAQFMDRSAMKAGATTVSTGYAKPGQEKIARELLNNPAFFNPPTTTPHDFTISRDYEFSFASQLPSPFTQNNRVTGKLFLAGSNWKKNPAVIFLHGWNGEGQYRQLFPFYARSFTKRGLNVLAMELPCHGRRKPPRNAQFGNFISDDIVGMLNATRQTFADLACCIKWLRNARCPSVGLWGFSLGGWLGGLFICGNDLADAAVLTVLVPRLDEAVEVLPFCFPIKEALHDKTFELEKLNLRAHTPKIAAKNIVIAEGVYDLFATRQSLNEVWEKWGRPERWREPQGHISILISIGHVRRAAIWFARKLAYPAGKS